MGAKLTKKAIALFENIKKIDEQGREYWSSRELAKILEYKDYRNFLTVINKAKESCSNSIVTINDHCRSGSDVLKVRQTIEDLGGTMPEDSPTAESIKTIEAKQHKEIKD